MNKNNYVIIMAGGIGSRFWPFSRKNMPKQFQDILETGTTLIQQTAARFRNICPNENIYVVTNEIYYDLVKQQLPFMEDQQILLEPYMRNTAPCIAYATKKISLKNPNANLIIAPADHIITEEENFEKCILGALETTAQKDILVTLGIRPTRPDTGYGYIQVSTEEQLGIVSKVKTFTEKPNLEAAKVFLESGEFVWNAGIFIWRVAVILENFKKQLPDIFTPFHSITDAFFTDKEAECIKEVYYQCRNISIDYGIMENAKNVYVLPSSFGWSDLGTWKSFYELSQKDENQNVIHGNVMAYETTNTIIKTTPNRLIITQGLDNYIVAEKDGVLVICQKDKEQEIKQYLSSVKDTYGDDSEFV